jgi:uncharacterized protein with HEPN domain
MAWRSTAERLADIRAAATDLRDIVADMDTDAFHALPYVDRLACRAVRNALSELGEAVKPPPDDVREQHPDVDWKGFAGLRDLVAHQYFEIDTSRFLPIIRDELADLLAAVASEAQR